MAVEMGQDLKKITFKDQSWLGLKTRSRKFRIISVSISSKNIPVLKCKPCGLINDFILGDATLSRHKGININDLHLQIQIASSPSGDTWRGRWQKNDIVAKILSVRDCNARVSRDFNEEFPKLRCVFHKYSHP